MFLFYRLLLAHFLADFPFQTNKIFAMKVSGIKGVLVHVGIVILVTLIIIFPYLKYIETWLALLALGLSHILIDHGKVLLNKQIRHDSIYFFLLDQIFHISFLFIFYSYPEASVPILIPSSIPIISTIYNSNKIILFLTCLIIVSYALEIFIFMLENHFCKDVSKILKRDYIGMVERCIIMSLMFINVYYIVFVPGVMIIKNILTKNILKQNSNTNIFRIISGPVLTIIITYLFLYLAITR